MRVFAYIRKSTDDKRLQQHSLKYQKVEILRRFKNEYKDIEFFSASESASKKGREVFSKILDKIELVIDKEEKVVLLSHAVDRLTRNLFDLARIDDLRQRGLQIKTCEGDYTGESAMMTLSIQAIFATDFVNKMKSKQRSAYEQGAREGKSFFGVPKGYKEGLIKGIREPNPEKYKGIVQIFKGFVKSGGGLSRFFPRSKEIAKMYSFCIASDKTLGYILRNKFYTGKIIYNGKEYKGAHKSIISQGLFNEVQKLLDTKGRNIYSIVKHNFLFSRKIICKCGRTLTGEIQLKKHVYYRCHNKNCDMRPLKEERVVESVGKMLKKRKLCQDKIGALLNIIKKEKNANIEEMRRVRKNLREKLNINERKISNLEDKYLEDDFSKERYEIKNNQLMNENKLIREEIEKCKKVWFFRLISTSVKLLECIKNRFLAWESGDTEQRRWILKLIVSNCYIDDKKELNIDIYQFFKTLISPKNEAWCSRQGSNL